MRYHYYLRARGVEKWTKVPKSLFMAAERAEGFTGRTGEAATFGFAGKWVDGTSRHKPSPKPHANITDRFGRVWTWDSFDGIYVHSGLLRASREGIERVER